MDGEENFEPDYLEDEQFLNCENIESSKNLLQSTNIILNNSLHLQKKTQISSDKKLSSSCPHTFVPQASTASIQKRSINNNHTFDTKKIKLGNQIKLEVENEIDVNNNLDDEDSSDDSSNNNLEGEGFLCEDSLSDDDDDDDEVDDEQDGIEKTSGDQESMVLYCNANDILDEENEIISVNISKEEAEILDTLANTLDNAQATDEKDKKLLTDFENEIKALVRQDKCEGILSCLESYCQRRRDMLDILCNKCAKLLDEPVTCYKNLIDQHFKLISGGSYSFCLKNCLPFIGARLILNAYLSKKFNIGLTILKKMMEKNIFFHVVTSKLFTVPNIIKIVIEMCFSEKDYTLIVIMVKKSDFFSYLPSLNVKNYPSSPLSYQQLVNLNVVFQYVLHHVTSFNTLEDQPKEIFDLVTLCLDILRLFLDSKNSRNCRLKHKFFNSIKDFSSKCWSLMKASLAGKLFNNIKCILELCLKHEGLINWKLVQHKTVVSFLLNHYMNDVDFYDCGITLLKLLSKDGVVQKFEEFNSQHDEHILTINKNATEDEITLIIILYIESIFKQFSYIKSIEQAKWTIILHNSINVFSSYVHDDDEDVKRFETVLSRSFSYLSWKKHCNSYQVCNMSISEKNIFDTNKFKRRGTKEIKNVPSILDINIPRDFIDKVVKQKSHNNTLFRPLNKNSHKMPSKSESQSIESKLIMVSSVKRQTSLPEYSTPHKSLASHPRFKSAFQAPQQEFAPFIHHPRFRTPPNNHGSMNMQGMYGNERYYNNDTGNTNYRNCNGFGFNSIDHQKEFNRLEKEYDRIKSDVSLRLQFYVNNGQIQQSDVDYLRINFTEKFYKLLIRKTKGPLVYDADAFEWMQTFLDYEINENSFN